MGQSEALQLANLMKVESMLLEILHRIRELTLSSGILTYLLHGAESFLRS